MPEAHASEHSLLLMQFRQFCGELLKLRDRLERGVPPSAPQVAAPVTPSGPAAAYAAAEAATAALIAAAQAAANPQNLPPVTPHSATVTLPTAADLMAGEREEGRRRLLHLLEQQTYQSMSLGGSFGISQLREAQYIMAALADEVLLNANWPGKSGWRLLEDEVFHSHASGELFFVKLDALIRQGEMASSELAMIFFQALALDFRGKYRNRDPERRIVRYRRQLFVMLFQTMPETMRDSHLFTQAYDGRYESEEFLRLPNPHRWWFAIAAVLLVWLGLSWIGWHSLTGGLDTQLHRIQQLSGQSTGLGGRANQP